MLPENLWLVLVDIVLIINILLIILVVVFERRNPMGTLSWILLLAFIPLLGFLMYVFLGQNLRRQKIFYLKEEEERIVIPMVAWQDASLYHQSMEFNDPRVAEYQDLIRMLLASSHSLISQDNQVEIFHNGIDLFDSMINDIKNAKDYIHMQYFIIRNDNLSRNIVKILAEKAAQGVEVKILYDGMGCIALPRKFFDQLHKNGGQTVSFYPPFLPYINQRINYRNHRKISVIDGKIGYVGGFNIGDEYLGLSKKLGYWRDIHLKIEGSAVDGLEMRFLLDWRYAARDPLPQVARYFSSRPVAGESAIQIVASGPDTTYPSIKNGYLKLINKAQQNIYIETPYYIPDESIQEALKIAALSGVDVRLMIPYKPDHAYVYWASLSYIGELLKAGVRCYRYKRGFLHSKMVVIDGFACSVGSANMDIRSFQLDFEVNAFIYDEQISSYLEKEFLRAINFSEEITAQIYANRSLYNRFKEGFFRLFSPLF